MKNKFTKQIAKQIAASNFDTTLDMILGIQDQYYNLKTDIFDLEQNFTEDLENLGIITTPKRIEIINNYYTILNNKAIKSLSKLYSK